MIILERLISLRKGMVNSLLDLANSMCLIWFTHRTTEKELERMQLV